MKLTRALLLGACPLALAVAPAFAQSTGSEQIETVVVTGTRVNLSSGLSSSEPVAKQMSTITQDYIETQTAGQTFFENLNLLPGINFTNSDAYGSSGGNIRMHGQPGDHISVTLDGMPLNDTGNYAMYTNQMIDAEITARVSINQGTTDVDSPTAAVTGGSIAARASRPLEDFGMMASVSGGSNSYQRYFAKVDTGSFGPWGTRAYVTASFASYDKFKGPGDMDKRQINGAIFQDMGSLGWMNLAFHFNRNRNHFYNSQKFYGGGVDKTAWDYDYDETCSYTTPTAGTVDNTMTGCSYWYKVRINPSDTGNIRFSSLWHLASDLTLTADASLQYVLANGGGTTKVYEHSGITVGSTGTYVSTATTATTTPYGCIAGGNGGCDLNGDGDVRDAVQLYTPSNTNTRRWGANLSLIYAPLENHTFRVAYSLDYGVHRQTGQYAFFSPTNGPYDAFAGWKDDKHKAVAADGTDLRKRDRNSDAILNQISFDYVGNFYDGTVQANIGFRDPFMERDLNNYCYTQMGSYYVLCTTEAPKSYDATTGIVLFNSTSYKYVMPASKVVKYNKFLPHLGLTVKPFGAEHQFFVNYTQELAAPRTDYLYTSTGSIYATTPKYPITAFEDVKPETSTTYTLGYRFIGEDLKASFVLWNTQVKDRIVSSWDEDQQIYTDRPVGGINFAGIDADAFYQMADNLWVYGSVSYLSARLTENVPTSSGYYDTIGNQFSETPKWTVAGRIQYKPIPEIKLGLGGKYVSSRYGDDTNTIRVPDYFTANADMTVDLDAVGMDGSSLRLNVDNIFDRHYYGNISTVTSGTSVYASPARLRTFSMTLVAKY